MAETSRMRDGFATSRTQQAELRLPGAGLALILGQGSGDFPFFTSHKGVLSLSEGMKGAGDVRTQANLLGTSAAAFKAFGSNGPEGIAVDAFFRLDLAHGLFAGPMSTRGNNR